jgi:hypothetical protein
MSDTNSAPVSLPAGSMDYETLKKGLDKAAKGDVDKYDGAVEKALSDANTSAHDATDPRFIPDHKFVEVENKDLGVTETIQVFDAKLAAEAEPATDAISGAGPANQVKAPAGNATTK